MEPEIIRNDTPLAILLRNHTHILLQFLLVAQSEAQADEGRNLVFFTPLTYWIIIFIFRRSFDHEFLYIQLMAKQMARNYYC